MRRMAFLLASITSADLTATSALVTDAPTAEPAGGGYAGRCGGGKIFLNADERQTFYPYTSSSAGSGKGRGPSSRWREGPNTPGVRPRRPHILLSNFKKMGKNTGNGVDIRVSGYENASRRYLSSRR